MKKIIICTALLASTVYLSAAQQSREIPTPPSLATYLSRSLLDIFWYNKPSKQITPIAIPAQLPKPQDLAQRLEKALSTAKKSFLFGASTSEHQCSHQCTEEECSYSQYCKDNGLTQPNREEYPMDLWHHYRAYLDYAADELRLNSLRFSIEWALVQPTGPHGWNQAVLDHYADLFVYAIKKGIVPIVCFHHYTDPKWFLYEKGGFEESGNRVYFKNFCVKVYEAMLNRLSEDEQALTMLAAMSPREPLFATFNSPEGYAFKGYREMQSPPSNPKKKGLSWSMKVLCNMMNAHVSAYYCMKKHYKQRSDLPEVIKAPKIGFLKNIHQLDPATGTWTQWLLSPLSRFICVVSDFVQNEAIYQFFTNGEFKTHIPLALDESFKNSLAIGALDWIGLNYYSNRYMCLTETIEEDDEVRKTDNNRYRIYPHGIYRAIVELSERLAYPLNVPIYVTENGIATVVTQKRYLFYQSYLYAIVRAVEEGYPVYGYLPWTLASNYEWPSKIRGRRDYGLCTVDKKNPDKIVKKEGAASYFDLVAAFFGHSE